MPLPPLFASELSATRMTPAPQGDAQAAAG